MSLKSFLVTQFRTEASWGFPADLRGRESAWKTGSPSSIPGSGRCLGEGNGNPLQYSWLENPMDRGAWRATVHGVTKSRTEQLTLTYASWVKGVKHGTSPQTGLAQLLQPSYCSIFYCQKNF